MKLMIIDGSSMARRAFHAFKDHDKPAVTGFFKFMSNIYKEYRPEYFVICWDVDEPTFRHNFDKNYKANRPPTDPAYKVQVEELKNILLQKNIPQLQKAGYEADDVIGTIVYQFKDVQNLDIIIVSSDKDLLQLLCQNNVSMLAPLTGVSSMNHYLRENTYDKYGLHPDHVVLFKTLAGDNGDNIKGIDGIGEKGAKELINSYGTLEKIVEAAQDENSSMTKRQRNVILEKIVKNNYADYFHEQYLVQIVCNLKTSIDLEFLKLIK